MCSLQLEGDSVHIFHDTDGLVISCHSSNLYFEVDFVDTIINGKKVYEYTCVEQFRVGTDCKKGKIILKKDILSADIRLVMKIAIERQSDYSNRSEKNSQGIFYFEVKHQSIQFLEEVNNVVWSIKNRVNELIDEYFDIYQKYAISKKRDWFISRIPGGYYRASIRDSRFNNLYNIPRSGVFFCNSGTMDLFVYFSYKIQKVAPKHAVYIQLNNLKDNYEVYFSIKVTDKPIGEKTQQEYVQSMRNVKVFSNSFVDEEPLVSTAAINYNIGIDSEHLILTNETQRDFYASMVAHPLFKHKTIFVASKQQQIIGSIKGIDINEMPMNKVIALVQIKVDEGIKIKSSDSTVTAYFDGMPVHRSFELYMDGPLLTVRPTLFENPALLKRKIKEIHESFMNSTNKELENIVDTVDF